MIDYQIGFLCQPQADGTPQGIYLLEAVAGQDPGCWWKLESSIPAGALKSAVTIKYAAANTAGYSPGYVSINLGSFTQRPDNTYGEPAPGCAAAAVIAATMLDIVEQVNPMSPPLNFVAHPAGSLGLKKNYAKARHKG